jgi:chromosomal replication initiator protein
MLLKLPDQFLDYLAHHITRNVRELEGALYKLTACASLTKEPIGLDLVRRTVEDYAASQPPQRSARIEELAADYFGTTADDLRSASRDRTVTQARAFAMYLLRKHTRMSFPEIGRLMGNKRHSTVLMAVRRVQQMLDHDTSAIWNAKSGPREVRARMVLDALEQQLSRAVDA